VSGTKGHVGQGFVPVLAPVPLRQSGGLVAGVELFTNGTAHDPFSLPNNMHVRLEG
jgi:hypothetical protein